HAGRRRNWFAELLPEGEQYAYMLHQGKLKRGDTLGFLARYGRDVAGALQIWDLEDPGEPRIPERRILTSAEIRHLLEDPIGAPLANAPGTGKSSLGGVQPKVVLARVGQDWAQAIGGYATTHILKPQLSGDQATIIFDEEYGSRLARRLGLADFESRIQEFDGLSTLVIERYDRSDGTRVHQEDFNQVLGASGNEKYQELGGVVSLKRVADALTRHAPEEDLRKLAQMVVFAVGIGNLDLHTKNLGLLHPLNGAARLAPTYDAVPQAHMPNDGRLALAINGKYAHDAVNSDDLEAELSSWGLRRTARIVSDTLDQLQAAARQELPLEGAFPGLQEQILGFVARLATTSR
ncbi:MAG: HipA domain-containing protein, partial [Actinobacteria bacterium]|nr:HipA domain-containing protein [Actinomycetota bacterium]